MLLKASRKITAILCCLFLTSCIKDVDFSQAEDIILTPDLEVDLIKYQLNQNDFLDSETNAYTPQIRDTVRLEFLNDTYIQESLRYAEFRFRHENRFPYRISSDIQFLSNNNRRQFNVSYEIPAGSMENPSIIDTIIVIERENIGSVRRSIQMATELEILDGGKDINGELDFLSKALYKFEFL